MSSSPLAYLLGSMAGCEEIIVQLRSTSNQIPFNLDFIFRATHPLRGVVDTDALKHFLNRDQMLEAGMCNPTGEIVRAKDLVNVTYFLCRPEAKMIRGPTIIVDGGFPYSENIKVVITRRLGPLQLIRCLRDSNSVAGHNLI